MANVRKDDFKVNFENLHISRKILLFSDYFSDIIWHEEKHRNQSKIYIKEISDLISLNQIENIDEQCINLLIKIFRNRGNKNSTINRKLAALYKLIKKAEKAGMYTRLPSYLRLKESNGRIRFITYDEENFLFSQIKRRNEDHYRLCVFLVDSGARVGEALALKHSDVIDGRATFWTTKSGRSRTVPLTKRAQLMIEQGRQIPGGPFSAIKYQKFRYDWNAAKKMCGLGQDKDVVPHILRHTCASRLVQAGIDLRRVQTFLGHQTIQMTLKYAHLATSDLDQCVIALERAKLEA